MKKLLFFALVLSFFALEIASPKSSLGATPVKKKAETLSARESLPQKFSKPADAVKTFFTALNDKDFDLAWESLSVTSQKQLIETFAKKRRMSFVKARELFDKNKEAVREQFWGPFRDNSKILPLISGAVYTVTDEKPKEAMVEMKSGGITNHLKAVKEGEQWRMGYVESNLQEGKSVSPPKAPAPESAP
ncbi:MAG: hypothetical protein U1F57_07830 [bacterium]